jgi:hypothetical protein
MTYELYESSPDRGGPITLYEFTVGPAEADVLRYTDADEEVFHDEKVWTREAIQRSELKSDGSLNKAAVTVRVPQENAIAALFTYYPPSYVVTLRILEGHFGDTDREFLVVFSGRLLNCEIEGVEAALTCEPSSTSMKRPGLRRNYQRQCPLVLYGSKCRATKTPYVCTVVGFADGVLTATPGAPLPLDGAPFSNGIAEWVDPETGRTEIRAILQAEEVGANVEFTLSGPMTNPPAQFTAYKGCAHTEQSCIEWHDNQLNYGGQLWIPFKNPIGTTSVYF